MEVLRDGLPCTPSAPKQRALLALLLLHANELVSTNRIIDELWGRFPPRSALAALQMYVSAVRRALAPRDGVPVGTSRRHPVLRTQPSGYLLRVIPSQLDLIQFRAIAAQGRNALAAGQCTRVSELLRQALGLWRGNALADLSRTGLLTAYAERLNQERLALLQERIGVDLCQGRSHEVVGELNELCAQYPLWEGFHQQLMLALYLAGRRVEALDVYTRFRRTMIDEAGIEPGPALRALQQAILDGVDPADRAHDAHFRQPLRSP